MVKKINIAVRILMILVVVFSILGYLILNLDLKLTPQPLFAVANLILVYLVTFLPDLLKRVNLIISDQLYLLILIAFFFGFVLGMGFKLYQVTTWFDTVMHTFNGGVIAIVGFALIRSNFENWQEHILLITIGAILFSISVGVIWEIYEFIADLISNGNMQRHSEVNTLPLVPLLGQKALLDTMIDLIVDTIGAIFASFIMYNSAIRSKKICNLFTVSIIKHDK